jgi:hypothetical protein
VDVYTADPASVLDYSKDWSGFLDPDETVVTATWTVADGIEEPEGKERSLLGAIATIWLTGGEVGTLYRVTSHIVTSDGREQEDSFGLYIADL